MGIIRGRSIVLAFLSFIGICTSAHAQSAPTPFDPKDTWTFSYRTNDFRNSAMLDLRSLNETVAGERGFVRLSPDGTGLVFGDGTPARFWGVISNHGKYPQAQLDEHARWLAKMGVNFIRKQFHGIPTNAGSTPDDVNQADIDEAWQYVAAMKKQGIYTAMIFFAPLNDYGSADLSKWGVAGYEVNYVKNPKAKVPWGVEFFNPVLRHNYQVQLKALFDRVNPYTGIRLADDPSILLIQLVTEDSLLFYTFSGIQPEQLKVLGKDYGDWLTTKYGSIDKALAAWGMNAISDGQHLLIPDDVPDGIVGFYNIWHATQPVRAGSPMAKRLDDQVAFLAYTEQKFDLEMIHYLRDDLKCKQLIMPGNWRPADPTKMQDALRWSYSPGEIMAENHFEGGGGWRSAKGDLFNEPTALKPLENGDAPPYVFKQVDGHATIITSTAWVYPNIHQAESSFLSATYASLDGLSGICWEGFSGQPEFDQTVVLKINPTTSWYMMWELARPGSAANFPATAMMYRLGYLSRGETVVHECRSLEDMWSRKMPLIADHGPYKILTDAMKTGAVDPLAFFVGPVRVQYDADPAKSTVADVSKYILRDKQLIRGNTGQVLLDYGKGICTIDAPKAQGVCGFLDQQGKFQLADATIQSTNPYASILLVPLDDQPLATSKKVLVQVATTVRPTGWQSQLEPLKPKSTPPAFPTQRVIDPGSAPFLVTNTHAQITLANPNLAKATLLDTNGYAERDVPVTIANGKCAVDLPPETMYLVLEGK